MKKEIDEFCQKIFMVLFTSDKKIRYNELYQKLTDYNANMSKPTFNNHLKHLIKDKIIQRNKEDKQNVTYQINWKKYGQLREAKQISQDIYNHIQNEKTFKSMSLRKQTGFTTIILYISQLQYLKLIINNILKPENKLLNYYAYTMLINIYRIYPEWLIDSFKESKEDKQEIITDINRGIEGLLQNLFETPLKNNTTKNNRDVP